jgi:hypothetical protein
MRLISLLTASGVNGPPRSVAKTKATHVGLRSQRGYGETMPEIMIRCPTFGRVVPTGLRTETILLDSLEDDLSIPLDCPGCLNVRRWRRKDAMVAASPRLE